MAGADLGSDFIDMDDLIEAIQLKHDIDTRPTNAHMQGYGGAPVITASGAEIESL